MLDKFSFHSIVKWFALLQVHCALLSPPDSDLYWFDTLINPHTHRFAFCQRISKSNNENDNFQFQIQTQLRLRECQHCISKLMKLVVALHKLSNYKSKIYSWMPLRCDAGIQSQDIFRGKLSGWVKPHKFADIIYFVVNVNGNFVLNFDWDLYKILLQNSIVTYSHGRSVINFSLTHKHHET